MARNKMREKKGMGGHWVWPTHIVTLICELVVNGTPPSAISVNIQTMVMPIKGSGVEELPSINFPSMPSGSTNTQYNTNRFSFMQGGDVGKDFHTWHYTSASCLPESCNWGKETWKNMYNHCIILYLSRR